MKLIEINGCFINKEKIIAVYERPISPKDRLFETVIEFEGFSSHYTYDDVPRYEQNMITTQMPVKEVIQLINE